MLNVQNNDIDDKGLPPLIGLHKTLKTVQIDGNPIKSIRRPIIERGSEAIMKCLRDKFVEGRDDMVEEWAIEMERDDIEYSPMDYQYQSQPYSYQQDNYGP